MREVTYAEALGLDPVATWSESDVTRRISDHYAGRENAFLAKRALINPKAAD